MTRIIQLARNCPDCGPDRLFEQHHPEPGGRPDSPDGQCHEWSCTACGAPLLADFFLPAGPSHAGESCAVPSLRDRVA
jgi:hypothetical protein